MNANTSTREDNTTAKSITTTPVYLNGHWMNQIQQRVQTSERRLTEAGLYEPVANDWESLGEQTNQSPLSVARDTDPVELVTMLTATSTPESTGTSSMPLDFTCLSSTVVEPQHETYIKYVAGLHSQKTHLWLTVEVKPGFPSENTGAKRLSLLVDSGCPPAMVMSIKQLPVGTRLCTAEQLGLPILALTVCNDSLWCKFRAVLSLELGTEWITTVAAVYDDKELGSRQFPPLLGQAFHKQHQLAILPSPMERDPVQENDGDPTVDDQSTDRPRTPTLEGHLARVSPEGTVNRLVSVFSSPPLNSNRYRFLTDRSHIYTVQQAAQCRTIRQTALAAGHSTYVPITLERHNTAAGEASWTHEYVTTSINPRLSRAQVEVIPTCFAIGGLELPTPVLQVINQGSTDLKLPTAFAICLANPLNQQTVLQDQDDDMVQLAYVDGALVSIYEPAAQLRILKAATADLVHRSKGDLSNLHGKAAVYKMTQCAALEALKAGRAITSDLDMIDYLHNQIHHLKERYNHMCNSSSGEDAALNAGQRSKPSNPTTHVHLVSQGSTPVATPYPICQRQLAAYESSRSEMTLPHGGEEGDEKDQYPSLSSQQETEEHADIEASLPKQEPRITADDANDPGIRDRMEQKISEHKMIATDLSSKQQQTLKELILRFPDVFLNNLANSGPLERRFQVKLTVADENKRQTTKQLELSFKSQRIVQLIIERYKLLGLVEPSDNLNWTTPLFIVAKGSPGPEGQQVEDVTSRYRLLCDVRALNSQLTAVNMNHTSIPLVSKLFRSLEGTRFMTQLDMASGYTQIDVAPESRHLLSFTVPGTHERLRFTKLIQGIAMAPAWYTYLLHTICHRLVPEKLLLYLDDGLVKGSTFEEMVCNSEAVLERCRRYRLTISCKKSTFGVRKAKFLGYQIDVSDTASRGISILSDKASALRAIKTPTSIKDLRMVLGVISYQRQFIPAFSEIAYPLFKLLQSPEAGKTTPSVPVEDVQAKEDPHYQAAASMTQEDKKQWLAEKAAKRRQKRRRKQRFPFKWDDAVHGAALRKLIDVIEQKVVLAIHSSDPKALLRLRVDTSLHSTGSMLEQLQLYGPYKGLYRPLGFASHKLLERISRYSATEREAYGIVVATTHYHHILCGRKFTILSDCKALMYCFTREIKRTARAASRMARWILALAPYRFCLVS